MLKCRGGGGCWFQFNLLQVALYSGKIGFSRSLFNLDISSDIWLNPTHFIWLFNRWPAKYYPVVSFCLFPISGFYNWLLIRSIDVTRLNLIKLLLRKYLNHTVKNVNCMTSFCDLRKLSLKVIFESNSVIHWMVIS